MDDFQDVMADTAVSSVIITGLGNFGAVQVCEPNHTQLDQLHPWSRHDGYLRWFDLATMATHLKQGRFVNRVSGRRVTDLNVPLGWGVVLDHRDIWAPNGMGVALAGLNSPDNKYIKPITDLEYLGRSAIKDLFPKQGVERNHHGLLFDLLSDEQYAKLAWLFRKTLDRVTPTTIGYEPYEDDYYKTRDQARY